MKSFEPDQTSDYADTAKRLGSTVASGVQALGDAACSLASESNAVELVSMQADGSGISVHCHTTSLATTLVDFSVGAGRRLDECSATTVRRIEYHHMNIYRWVTSGTFQIPENASLIDAEVQQCQESMQASQVRVSVPFTGSAPMGFSLACVRYDASSQEWTTAGVSLESLNNTDDGVQLNCLSSHGGGVYAAALTTDSDDVDRMDRRGSASTAQTAIAITVAVVSVLLLSLSLCVVTHARRAHPQKAKLVADRIGDEMPIDIETKFGVVSTSLSQLSRGLARITSEQGEKSRTGDEMPIDMETKFDVVSCYSTGSSEIAGITSEQGEKSRTGDEMLIDMQTKFGVVSAQLSREIARITSEQGIKSITSLASLSI